MNTTITYPEAFDSGDHGTSIFTSKGSLQITHNHPSFDNICRHFNEISAQTPENLEFIKKLLSNVMRCKNAIYDSYMDEETNQKAKNKLKINIESDKDIINFLTTAYVTMSVNTVKPLGDKKKSFFKISPQ